ncbi:arginase family protein [Pseudomonas putida]|uniref:arginase family protein n=1 Tax=Pseudomonas putida TaxID=303 RepID=UPI000C9C114E|nr:arginase family protein [Pseudomonas putida]PNG87242.1 Formimidoylglutamase [Pseudomonas putida]
MNIFFLDILQSSKNNDITITRKFLEHNRCSLRTSRKWNAVNISSNPSREKIKSPTISEAINSSGVRIFIAPDHRSTGVLLSNFKLHSQTKIHMVVLDAHSDCQGSTELLTNYNVMLWITEKFPNIKKTIVGFRDTDRSSDNLSHAYSNIFPTSLVNTHGIENIASYILDTVNPSDKIWLSIDLDVLDPLLFTAVNTPISGGLLPREIFTLIQALEGKLAIAEIVEFTSATATRSEFLFMADLVSVLCEI